MTALPPLWHHQADAIEFAVDRPATMLDHVMGAGKSRTLIELMRRWRPRRTLLVCPARAVRGVWPGQFDQWDEAGEFRVITPEERWSVKRRIKTFDDEWNGGAVFVANYEAMRTPTFRAWAAKRDWDLVVADEVHRLKSPRGKQSSAMAAIGARAEHRIGMTGTIMPRDYMDLWGEYRFLERGLLPQSYFVFRKRFAVMGGFDGKEIISFKNTDQLMRQVGKITHHAGDEVLDLPPFTRQFIRVRLGVKAQRAYDGVAENLRAAVESGEITAKNGLVRLLRLQQITSGQAALDSSTDGLRRSETIDTAKREALAELLDGTDEPFVVFGQFTHDVEQTVIAAEYVGATVGRLSGGHDDLAAFQRGDVRVLAVQIATGAEAIDLTRARYCAYLSTGFNLGLVLQSERRVRRPGQERPVTYYHLVADDTVDWTIHGALRRRRGMVEAAIKELLRQQQQQRVT